MPKNLSRLLEWYNVKLFITKSFSEEERYVAIKTLLNSLGNLTIIRDKKNSSLGNNPWETKVKAYANGSFSERQISSKTEMASLVGRINP